MLNVHWKDWCWSSNTLVTWCEELTYWKRPWCWERLKAGGEGDDRGWDGWMASPTPWTWVWASSGSWWWIRKTGMLQSMSSQRVEHDWETELNWMELKGFPTPVWPILSNYIHKDPVSKWGHILRYWILNFSFFFQEDTIKPIQQQWRESTWRKSTFG